MSDPVKPATSARARYRLKPLEVEAVQWFEGADIPEVIWYQPPELVIGSREHDEYRFTQAPFWAVVDATGPQEVWSGDWILTDQDGHVIVCENDSFSESYERIDSEDTPK